MWQLEIAATYASSGSTCAGFEYGTGTTDGDEEAGIVAPPSNVQVCSREYLPLRKSGPVRFQLTIARCSDMITPSSRPTCPAPAARPTRRAPPAPPPAPP